MHGATVCEIVGDVPSSNRSNVKITAYGGTANACKVAGWWSGSSGTSVSVACFDTQGQPVDSYFTIVYSNAEIGG